MRPSRGGAAAPVLVGCAHGTASRPGRAAIRSVLAEVSARRPGLDVREAFVDVQAPAVADVMADLAPCPAVVVPLLLSTGFHVVHDIGAATRRPRAWAAAPLGPHPLLVQILLDRLTAVDLGPDDAVVLAAAGSSDPAAAVAVQEVATALAARLGRAVPVGFGAGAGPGVSQAVAAARASAERVVVAAYLLAEGHFLDRLRGTGADVVTGPLAPDPRLAELVLDRYDESLRPA